MKVHLPESVDEAVGAARRGRADRRRHARDAARSTPTDVAGQPAPRRAGRASSSDGDASRSARRRRSPQVGREVAFLRDAIESIASPTIRNLATVGGNLFVPAAARRPRGLPARARRASVDHRRDGARGRRARGRGPRDRGQLHGPRALVLHARRCAAGRTPRRSSPSPPTARGSRSAASPRGPSARPPPRRRSPSGDIDRAAELSVEAADPFDDAYASAWYRRRVLPVHVRRALSPCRLASSNWKSTASREEFLAKPGTTLLSALRDTLGLTAAKRGCGVGHVRHVHLPARRRRRHVLPGPGRDDQRRHGQDARGRDAVRRHAGAAPAGLPGRLRHPVRLLHAGDDHGRRGAAGGEPGPDARGRRARDLRQRLPLHGLREHHPRDPRRRGRTRHERQRLQRRRQARPAPRTRWATSPAARSTSRTSTRPGCCT